MQCVRACLVAQIVSHSATRWTVTCQAPLSMGYSRLEYWSGFPLPGNLPELGIETLSPAFSGRFFSTELFEFEFKYWVKIRIRMLKSVKCWVKIRIRILKSEGNKRFNKKGQQFVHWSWQGFPENWSYLSPLLYHFLCLFFFLFFKIFICNGSSLLCMGFL